MRPFVVDVGLGDADVPRLAFGALTFRYHLTAYIHEVVLTSVTVQQLCNDVAGLTFRHRTSVDLHPRVRFIDIVVNQFHFVEAHKLADAIYLSMDRFFGIPISRGVPESPVVHQRRDGDVERPSGEGIDLLRFCPHRFEERIRRCVAISVDSREDGVGVEQTQTRVKRLKGSMNAVFQILGSLVTDVIIRTKDLTFVMVILSALGA